jgi:hypothetical protein
MDKDKIIDISKNVEDKSNKDLTSAKEFLEEEFKKTKSLIIDLTRHLESVEQLFYKINKELDKRKIK